MSDSFLLGELLVEGGGGPFCGPLDEVLVEMEK